MKKCPKGFHIIGKSIPRAPGDIPLTAIVYKYISQKVFGFTATEGAIRTEPGVPYLSCYPENYSIVCMHHVI